jgi:hypothetical protein
VPIAAGEALYLCYVSANLVTGYRRPDDLRPGAHGRIVARQQRPASRLAKCGPDRRGGAISVFAILQAPDRSWSDPLVWGGIITGAVIAAVFGVVEFRRRHPLLDVRLLADPCFATGVATIVMPFGATFGFFYIGMQYVRQLMPILILATGIGMCTAPTTSAIMGAVPDEGSRPR